MPDEELQDQLREALSSQMRAAAMLENAERMHSDDHIGEHRLLRMKAQYERRQAEAIRRIHELHGTLRERLGQHLARLEEITSEEDDLALRVDVGQFHRQDGLVLAAALDEERAALEEKIERLTCLIRARTPEDVASIVARSDRAETTTVAGAIDADTRSTALPKQSKMDGPNGVTVVRALERVSDAMVALPVVEALANPLKDYLRSGHIIALIAGIALVIAAGLLPLAEGSSVKLMNFDDYGPVALVLSSGGLAAYFSNNRRARAGAQAICSLGCIILWAAVAFRLNSVAIRPSFGCYLFISAALSMLLGAHMQAHER